RPREPPVTRTTAPSGGGAERRARVVAMAAAAAPAPRPARKIGFSERAMRDSLQVRREANSRFPAGMTERKAKAKTTAMAKALPKSVGCDGTWLRVFLCRWLRGAGRRERT